MNPLEPGIQELALGAIWGGALLISGPLVAAACLHIFFRSATARATIWQWAGYTCYLTLLVAAVFPHIYLFYCGEQEPLPFPFLRAPGDRCLPVNVLCRTGISPGLAEGCLLIVWALGVTIYAIPFAAQWYSALVTCRRGRLVQRSEVEAVLGEHARLLDRWQAGSHTEVRLSRAVPLAACWRWRQPVILVSTRVWSQSPSLVRAVLLHELAHLQHNHSLANVAFLGLRCLFWFNPLVHIANRLFRRWAERACDEYVLEHGFSARDYARLLVGAIIPATPAKGSRKALTPVASTFVCVRGSRELKERIAWLLEQRAATSLQFPLVAVCVLLLSSVAAGVIRVDLRHASIAEGRARWTPWPPFTASIASTFGITLRDYPLDSFLYDRHPFD